jgi:serine/threonine protein kinase
VAQAAAPSKGRLSTWRRSRFAPCQRTSDPDLYAAGEILFEMATGERPFKAPNMFALIDQVLNQPPRRHVPSIQRLAAFRRRRSESAQKDPDQRYHHADDFEAHLRGGCCALPAGHS